VGGDARPEEIFRTHSSPVGLGPHSSVIEVIAFFRHAEVRPYFGMQTLCAFCATFDIA